jgi:hypothetical protein
MTFEEQSNDFKTQYTKKTIRKMLEILFEEGAIFDDTTNYILGVLNNMCHGIIYDITAKGEEQKLMAEFILNLNLGLKEQIRSNQEKSSSVTH